MEKNPMAYLLSGNHCLQRCIVSMSTSTENVSRDALHCVLKKLCISNYVVCDWWVLLQSLKAAQVFFSNQNFFVYFRHTPNMTTHTPYQTLTLETTRPSTRSATVMSWRENTLCCSLMAPSARSPTPLTTITGKHLNSLPITKLLSQSKRSLR